ncbi:MAG: nucleotide exchange factor GrpE [Fidelibacterota bacterium]|nr:MAG: nucleotide exchange factor GrpE [Candidatus Neomarinimicrobiota bacterium]
MKTEPPADSNSTDTNGSPVEEDRSRDKSVKPKTTPPKKPRHTADAAKVTKLEKQLEELEQKYIRLRAEYDNHIKRTTKEKGELIAYAGAHVFRLILPILDDLQRTVNHAREDDSQKDDLLIQGVAIIIEKFTKLLESEGVEVFTSVGEEFDPELHEALMTRSSDEHPEGIILEVYEPGYRYRERILRHAKVVVSG